MILTATTSLDQRKPGSNGNEVIHNFSKDSRTRSSTSRYLGRVLPFCRGKSAYSTVPSPSRRGDSIRILKFFSLYSLRIKLDFFVLSRHYYIFLLARAFPLVLHSYSLVPHISKKLSKLLLVQAYDPSWLII